MYKRHDNKSKEVQYDEVENVFFFVDNLIIWQILNPSYIKSQIFNSLKISFKVQSVLPNLTKKQLTGSEKNTNETIKNK